MKDENENEKLVKKSYEELYQNILYSLENYSKDGSEESIELIKSSVNILENFSKSKIVEKLDNIYINQLIYLQGLKIDGINLEKLFSKPQTNTANNYTVSNNNLQQQKKQN
jgi:hypothetical protein